MEEKDKKNLGLLILISTALFAFIAVSASGLVLYQKAYAGKIYPNVYFDNTDIGGLSKNQANYIIKKRQNQLLDKEIALKTENKSVNVKLSDTGIALDVDQIVESSYQIGRGGQFYTNILESLKSLWHKQIIALVPKINQSQYDGFVNLIIPQLNIEPKDAALAIENGNVIETKEVVGQRVLTDKLNEKIVLAAIRPEINEITLESVTQSPTVSSYDSSEAKAFALSILEKKMTLTYENFAFVPSKTDLGRWINFQAKDGKIIASIDDSQVKAYLNTIASNFEIQKTNKKINAVDNSVITEGKEGKYLDKNDALTQIKTGLNSNTQFAVALKTYTEAPQEERVIPAEGLIAGRFPGKYVDIDLAQQKLCKVEGNQIGECFIISSGKASMPTPIGTFTVTGKNPKQWSSKYGLWMPYWQQFNGAYGIHELPEWPNGYKEGENHLGIPVSHGCVRLGIGAAENLFNWTSIGTPVYIHK